MGRSPDSYDASQILFYLSKYSSFSERAKSRVTKSPRLKSFLLAAIQNDCYIMDKILLKATKECAIRMRMQGNIIKKQKLQEAAKQRREEKELSRKRMGENRMTHVTTKRFKHYHDVRHQVPRFRSQLIL